MASGSGRRQELDQLLVKDIGRLQAMRERLADPRALMSELEALHNEGVRLLAQETRLLGALRRDEQKGSLFTPRMLRGLVGDRPLRDVVLDTLDVIRTPAPARTLSEVASALGWVVPAERLASLRRDEERAYRRNPGGRPQWIVPGINALTLTAMPRLVASSAWPAEERVVGVRSGRVGHLRLLRALVERWEQGLVSPAAKGKLEELISRLAESVANAIDPGEALDTARVREAVAAELALIEPLDQEERDQAGRLIRQLTPADQLWGRSEDALDEEEGARVRRIAR